MTDLTPQEIQAEMAKRVQTIYAAVRHAEDWAKEHQVSFSLEIEYAMGGYYDPTQENEYTESFWFPSSIGC
jgi:hypothetical protein